MRQSDVDESGSGSSSVCSLTQQGGEQNDYVASALLVDYLVLFCRPHNVL
jgi:hypothetical protein